MKDMDKPQICEHCDTYAFRKVSFPNISYLRMGLDATSFPTSGDKWAKMHEKEGAKSEDSLSNLKHV